MVVYARADGWQAGSWDRVGGQDRCPGHEQEGDGPTMEAVG